MINVIRKAGYFVMDEIYKDLSKRLDRLGCFEERMLGQRQDV